MYLLHQYVGVITVSNSDLLDYETSQRHRLIVIATNSNYNNDNNDNYYHYDYATVWINVVDINDNVPQFYQQRYLSAVWENNPANTFVLQVCSSSISSSSSSCSISLSVVFWCLAYDKAQGQTWPNFQVPCGVFWRVLGWLLSPSSFPDRE